MCRFVFLIAALVVGLDNVQGHGRVTEPPNRSTLWRLPEYSHLNLPRNYDDNQLFCGGAKVQWEENGGRCGLCGDNFADPQPRANEWGGLYGQGPLVRSYPSGVNIPVTVNITASHLGHFEFHLCNLDKFEKESEECFDEHPLSLVTGGFLYTGQPDNEISESKDYKVYLTLPQIKCEHCVFRWHYKGGNSWGTCADGSQALGCGAQETFRTCSDIVLH